MENNLSRNKALRCGHGLSLLVDTGSDRILFDTGPDDGFIFNARKLGLSLDNLKAVGREPNIIHVPTDVLIHEDNYLEGALLGDKAWSVIFDNSKIKRLVPSFVCEIPFAVGIRETLQWFEARPERMVISERTNSLIQRICNRMERLHID